MNTKTVCPSRSTPVGIGHRRFRISVVDQQPATSNQHLATAKVKFLGWQELLQGHSSGLRKVRLYNVLDDVMGPDGEVLVVKNSTVTEGGLAHLGLTLLLEPVRNDLAPAAAAVTNVKLSVGMYQLGILDMVEEGDFERAAGIAEQLLHELRVLAREQRADEAGVVQTV